MPSFVAICFIAEATMSRLVSVRPSVCLYERTRTRCFIYNINFRALVVVSYVAHIVRSPVRNWVAMPYLFFLIVIRDFIPPMKCFYLRKSLFLVVASKIDILNHVGL